MMLNDFMRGRIPWYTPAPKSSDEEGEEGSGNVNGRGGRLGEMPRKRPASETLDDTAEADVDAPADEVEGAESSDNEDFEGFDAEGNSDDVLSTGEPSGDEGQGEAPVAQTSSKASRPNKKQRR